MKDWRSRIIQYGIWKCERYIPGIIIRVSFSTPTTITINREPVIFRWVQSHQLHKIKVDNGGRCSRAPLYANVHAQHRPILLMFSCVKIPVNRRFKTKIALFRYKRSLVLYSRHVLENSLPGTSLMNTVCANLFNRIIIQSRRMNFDRISFKSAQ